MAASCLGTFGTYQYMWSRHAFNDGQGDGSTVWVTKRYKPTDLRVTAPVPRQKLMAPEVKDLPRPADHWMPPRHASWHTSAASRDHEANAIYRSQPSTRCEEFSTLREMLPSNGRPVRSRPPNWGTWYAQPPHLQSDNQRRFPHINSPMTRYVDDMHLTNRLFKLH